MSQEINKQIHEKVFEKCAHVWKGARAGACRYVYAQCVKCNATASMEAQPIVPDYSGNIADAWVVVEEMQGRKFEFWLTGTNKRYCATFSKKSLKATFCEKVMPLAICLAALKAIEEL